MRKWFISLIAVVMAISLSACGSGGNSSASNDDLSLEELKVALPAAPPSLDPHQSVAVVTGQIDMHVLETLVTFDKEYKIQPLLAKSIDISEDKKTITFPLRDVKFQNGESLTSSDVVASIKRWASLSPTGRSAMDGVQVEAPDDKTVVFKLSQPSQTILYDLAYPTSQAAYILPKSIIDKAGKNVITDVVGTGPYKIEAWKKDQYVHLVKYEEYASPEGESSGLSGKREATIKDIYFHFVPNSSTRLNGIKSGEYDVATSIPNDQYQTFRNDPSLATHKILNGYPGLIFNTTSGLFSDQKVRQAVLASLDLDKVMLAAAGDKDFYRADPGLIPKEMTDWYTNEGNQNYNQNDPSKAKELLQSADYNSQKITIMTTKDYDYMYNAALEIQQELKSIDMNVELAIYDWPTLLAMREHRDKWNAFVSGFPNVAQPTQTLFLDSKNHHASGYASKKMDGLLNEIRYATDHQEAYNAWKEAQGLYWDDLPVIKLGDIYNLAVAKKGIQMETYFSLTRYWNE